MRYTNQTTFTRGEQQQDQTKEAAATVTSAADASGCGAIGCATGGDLLQVQTENGERRVLCPRHAGEYLSREVAR